MKNKSLIFLIISVLLILVSCRSGTDKNSTKQVTVFSNRETEYVIITPEDASEEVLELANGLFDLSGARPSILTDAAEESAFEIIIGNTSRAATSELVNGLREAATVSAFNFIVAESDGKIIILSDYDVGYIYALEYIEEKYISDGTFSIPSGAYDLRQVVWDDYYASDRYLNILLAEADKNRYETGNQLFDNEMNRYDDTQGSTVMTIEQAIKQYESKVANFITSDFGEYTAETFTSANKYAEPSVLPGESHPRILFTEKTIDTVRNNLTAEENSAAYIKYIALSDSPCDGKFPTLTSTMVHNYDASVVSKIEAKAFRFAMERDTEKYPDAKDDPASLYGYEAIYAAKNAMLTINVPHSFSDWCRTYGFLMYAVSCTYDWCYELLTETDKTQLVNGCVNLLGMHLEIVCYAGSGNKVPTEQGAAYGHGAEDQLLVDYLSFAIACYNEAPEIYNFVAGRILDEYVEMQNFLYASGNHWEGSMYGGVRSAATVVANVLFSGMTNGDYVPFELEEVAETFTYYIRPDGQAYRMGDIDENYSSTGALRTGTTAIVCYYASNLYENSYLKSYVYSLFNEFSYFKIGVAGLTPVQLLATNNTTVSHVYTGTAPLTKTTSYPLSAIFAKSANNDSNAFSLYMTMPESYLPSHAHMDCGSFQIYYNGSILASDSGAYASWGGVHHMGYNMQTVSSNSIMVFNPNLAGTYNSYRINLIYTGGQSVARNAVLPNTLSELMKHEGLGQCTSLGSASVEEDGVYLYSYMGGDMTKAYDSETIDEVTRYMFAVATGDKNCPYVFMTFDRITSDDASYRKSALIHMQNEPTVVGSYYLLSDATSGELKEISGASSSGKYILITNGEGKLVVQNVGYDTEYTVIGGEDYEYWIAGVDDKGNYSLEDGYNIPSGKTLVKNSIAEYGWGRVEISPAKADLTNYMLTVMYVTDAANYSDPVAADNICSESLAGAEIFGKAVLFPKNEKLLTEESSFTLDSAADCYVAGVSAGSWQILKDGAVIETVTVNDGTNLITFTASGAGTYTLKPVN